MLRIADPGDGRVTKRVAHEITVWKSLFHPNIQFFCGLYHGMGEFPALVSPWYDNGDINHYLRARASEPNLDTLKLDLVRRPPFLSLLMFLTME